LPISTAARPGASAGAEHEQRLAAHDSRAILERMNRRSIGHRQCCSNGEIRISRKCNEVCRVDQRFLGESARDADAEHGISRLDIRNAIADRLDDAREFAPGVNGNSGLI
jgi:hypothetical protein